MRSTGGKSEAGDVAIIGGGLVGSLLAVFLAGRGLRVTVWERRADDRAGESAAGRSINLVLTTRGIRALERVGLAASALALTVPVRGRMMHSVTGEQTYQPYGRDETECNHSISRAGLNRFLVDEAERRGARFRFRMRLVDVDPPRGRMRFHDEARDEPFETEAPLVLATDGAGSAVRNALVARGRIEESVEPLRHGYKELVIPAASDGAFRIEKNALHLWPRGELMLMALPNIDGSFTVTLYLPWAGPCGFDAIDAPARVLGLFGEHFPDAIPLIGDLVGSFLRNPTGSLGTVRCAPWHHAGRLLLLGDAAHAIVPFFGQGMNCGFEDCTVLDALLDDNAGDWHAVLPEFERRRKPDTDAIAHLALENFVEMRDRAGDPRFLLRKQVEQRLERELPGEYRSRYALVMYTDVPYRVALEAGRAQDRILDELCANLDEAGAADLARARRLVRRELTPLFERHHVQLG